MDSSLNAYSQQPSPNPGSQDPQVRAESDWIPSLALIENWREEYPATLLVVSAVTGLLLVFFGFKFKRLFLFCLVFIGSYQFLSLYVNLDGWPLTGLAVLLASTAVALYKIIYFAIGVLIGVMLAMLLNLEAYPMVLIGLGALSGFLFVYLGEVFLIALTVLLGTQILITGLQIQEPLIPTIILMVAGVAGQIVLRKKD